jgi:hypothetical protein
MRVSSYKKLRIGPDWLEKRARETGFEVVASGPTLVLRRS